jgi:proteasome lid subunit RPN8/RPN11
MLLAAGYETAVAIANLVLFADATTDEHADGIPVSVLKQPYEDWALLPGAIEETLRFYPPYPASRRKVVADTELGGQAVNAGSWVVGWLTSANRDPDLFPDPSRFDIRRWPNEHLTFGDGQRLPGCALGSPGADTRAPGPPGAASRLRRDRTEPLARTYGTVDALERLPYRFAGPGQWS